MKGREEPDPMWVLRVGVNQASKPSQDVGSWQETILLVYCFFPNLCPVTPLLYQGDYTDRTCFLSPLLTQVLSSSLGPPILFLSESILIPPSDCTNWTSWKFNLIPQLHLLFMTRCYRRVPWSGS